MSATPPSGPCHMSATPPSGHGHTIATIPSGPGHTSATRPSSPCHMSVTPPSGLVPMSGTLPGGHFPSGGKLSTSDIPHIKTHLADQLKSIKEEDDIQIFRDHLTTTFNSKLSEVYPQYQKFVQTMSKQQDTWKFGIDFININALIYIALHTAIRNRGWTQNRLIETLGCSIHCF